MSVISTEILMCVAPDAVERAQRLQTAVRMLKSGVPEKEARRRVQRHYECSRMTAWRAVEEARDLT